MWCLPVEGEKMDAAAAFVVLPQDAGLRLGGFLRRQGVSLSVVRGLKYIPGGICLNGKQAFTSAVVQPGDVVELCPAEEEGFSAMPQRLPITVLYESAHALVLDKPAGQVTHPDRRHPEGSLANAYCGLMQERGRAGVFRPMGRLDADTSGLVLCAANALAAHALNQSFEKGYLALAGGRLPLGAGTVDAPLDAMPGEPVMQQVCAQGKPSRTDYRVLAAGEEASLVAVRPRTGRTHQIRVHFAHLGHPLLGDALYGGEVGRMHRHALHCAWLAFCQWGGAVQVVAGLPEDMLRAGESLGLALPGKEDVHKIFMPW